MGETHADESQGHVNLFEREFWIGIVGSRRRNRIADFVAVGRAFFWHVREFERHGERDRIRIVSGGCPDGADAFAEHIAEWLAMPIRIHYPDKFAYLDVAEPIRSTRQNYERNTLIARDAEDVLIACVAADRKGGAEDTITKWRRLHGDHGRLVLV